MNTPDTPVTARTLLRDFRSGSSLPALVAASDNASYVIKWKGTGEGVLATIVDLLTLETARAVGITVPETRFVAVEPALAGSVVDSELKELLLRSAGLNLGIEYLEDAMPYRDDLLPLIDEERRQDIFLFDVWLLNIDRIENNPNMLLSDQRLFCIDYAAAIDLKALVEGRNYPEPQLLPLLRRHPFCDPFAASGVIDRLSSLDNGFFTDLAGRLPDEWLAALGEEPGTIRRRIAAGMAALRDGARENVARRLAALEKVPLQSAAERRAQSLRNSIEFQENYVRKKITE